ncbi:MAG: hypothetical protein Kow00122_18750 [Thermoleophilia bacterium]
MQTGRIVRWLKEQGAAVAADEPLVEVETEKINNVIESPAAGVIRRLCAEEGDELPIGRILAVITAADEDWSEDQLEPESSTASAVVRSPAGSSYTQAGGRRAARAGDEMGTSTPAARRLARERGIDLRTVVGSGPGGRVGQEDVLRAMAATTGLHGSRFVLVSGLAVHLLDQGHGPAVLLLHGLGGSTFAWLPVFDELARDFRVIVPDLVGFGYSDKPAADYSLGFFARFVADLVTTLRLTKVHLIGNSLGGAIALAFAQEFPDLVGRLVLADTAGLGRAVLPELYAAVLRPPSFETIRETLALLFYDRRYVTEGVVEETLRQRLTPGGVEAVTRALQTSMAPGRQLIDVSGTLRALRERALLIWGEQDGVVPLAQARAAAEAAEVPLIVFERCGHCPQVEQAARFAEAAKEFLVG